MWLTISRIVRVANVQEKHAFGMKGPFDFVEHFYECIDVGVHGGFVADLAFVTVVSNPIVWWRRDGDVEHFLWQRCQHLRGIALD